MKTSDIPIQALIAKKLQQQKSQGSETPTDLKPSDEIILNKKSPNEDQGEKNSLEYRSTNTGTDSTTLDNLNSAFSGDDDLIFDHDILLFDESISDSNESFYEYMEDRLSVMNFNLFDI